MWGVGPMLHVFDTTSPTAIKDGTPVLANNAIEWFQTAAAGCAAADVVAAPSADGFKIYIYYFDHNCGGLGGYVAEFEPVINDVLAVGMKGEDVGITVRFKIKSDGDTFTFHLAYTSLESLKLFLERLALCDQDTISWESTASDHAMYFYPQTIGPFKHMGQFQIYSVEHSRLLH